MEPDSSRAKQTCTGLLSVKGQILEEGGEVGAGDTGAGDTGAGDTGAEDTGAEDTGVGVLDPFPFPCPLFPFPFPCPFLEMEVEACEGSAMPVPFLSPLIAGV